MSGAAHSLIPPSSAAIWGKPDGCPGWPTMIMLVPTTDSDTEESLEGTAAHNLGARLIRYPAPENQVVATFDEQTGVMYDSEIYECAEIYASYCRGIIERYQAVSGEIGIERQISAPSVHPLNWGTCDFYCFSHAANPWIIDIVEYKHGHGKVAAFENWQGLNYLAAILDAYNVTGIQDQQIIVRITVIQPRAYKPTGSIDTWQFVASDARGFINQLHASAEKALGVDPKCHTGTHCRYCKALAFCPAAQSTAVALIEQTSAAKPYNLSPAHLSALGDILTRAESHISALLTAVKEQIESNIRQGKSIPSWWLKRTVGAKKWNAPKADIIAMADAMGVDIRKDDILTPTQAEKAGLDTAIVDSYATRPTGHKLERITSAEARRVFI